MLFRSWDLVVGAAGGEVAYSNANARIGVGNGTAAADPVQTALQGGSTAFAAMEATYPIRAAQTLSFRSIFGSGVANFAWEEWTVDNGAARNRNMNRKVQAMGTKVSGAVWQLTVDITLS